MNIKKPIGIIYDFDKTYRPYSIWYDLLVIFKNSCDNNPYLLLSQINAVDFFKNNKDIGFSNMPEKYKDDIRNNKSNIVMIQLYEGYSGMSGNEDLEIIEKWCIKENFPFNSVHYICGNLIVKSIFDKKKLNFNVYSIQNFEKSNDRKNTTIYFSPDNKKYLYLLYNRVPRENRIFLINELIEKGLFEFGAISLNCKKNFVKPQYMSNTTFDFILNNCPFYTNKKVNLDINQAAGIVVIDYEKTFLSIVTETLIDKDTLFISEKTWKPIIMGHPFIIYGNQNTLKYLKGLGYKTFDRWIDESYDLEEDTIARCKLIVKEIEKISKYSIDKLKDIREDMYEICEFNRKYFNQQLNKNYVGNTNLNIINILNDIWNELIKDKEVFYKKRELI